MSFLERALADLNEGIRSLLGPGRSRPRLVDELLEGRRSRTSRTTPLRVRSDRRGAGRSRPASMPRLVRVK